MKVTTVGQDAVRALQDHAAAGRRADHLQEPAAQAAPGTERETTGDGTSRGSRSAAGQAGRDRGHVHLRDRAVVGHAILTDARVDPTKRVKAWSDDETARVRDIIEREYKVEGDLRREISMNVKRLMDIGSYRGHPAPQGPAGARAAHPHQRAHPQGPAQGRHGQEEADGRSVRPATPKKA